MASKLQEGVAKLKGTTCRSSTLCDVLTIVVDDTKKANGHVSGTVSGSLEEDDHGDSDEDKEEDGVPAEAGATGGSLHRQPLTLKDCALLTCLSR